MMKIGMLLPDEQMFEMAKQLIKEEKGEKIEIVYLKVIHTVDAVNEARFAVEAGAHILIARGYQAKLIQQYTNISVVEVRFHAQEIGLLLQKAKASVKKEHPHIGLIAFENMLCDLSYMETLFDVKLDVEYLNQIEDAEQVLLKMAQNRPDIIIGGKATCQIAETMGYPTLFYQSTEESLREALAVAKNMSIAAESEKFNTAEFETVLDTSFNGIVKINVEGKIIVINKLVENLIGKNKEEVVGLPIEMIFPQIDMELIDNILKGRSESYTTSISMRKRAWMVGIASIQYDDQVTGAIISFQKISEIVANTKKVQSDMILHGFSAQTNFQYIYKEN